MKKYFPALILFSIFIAVGCSKSKTPGPTDNGSKGPPKLEIVSGNNQTAKVGFYPADSVKVKATGNGFDYSKYYVEFKGSGCNADMSVIYGISANGITAVGSYRLAGDVGAQTLQATLLEISTKKRIDSVTFNLTGTAPTAGVNYAACTPAGTAYSFTKTGTGRLFALFRILNGTNLKYSDDDGISWNTVKGLNSSDAIRIVKSDGKNQIVAYSTMDDLYYSADNGATWKLQNASLKGISVDQLTYTPSGKLFLITNDRSFYYSADNGINWIALTVKKDGGIIPLISPQEGPEGVFYVIARSQGLFKSVDDGSTWKELPDVMGGNGWDGSTGLYADPNNGWLYKSAEVPATIYLSKDGGNKYSKLVTTGVSADSFKINNGILYFEGEGSIYKIDGANNVIKIISTSQNQASDGDFIVSNSGNVLFRNELSTFPQYVKP